METRKKGQIRIKRKIKKSKGNYGGRFQNQGKIMESKREATLKRKIKIRKRKK